MAVARDSERLESLAREAQVETLAADISDPSGCQLVIRETRQRLGPIEILVNNAGRGGFHDQPIWEQDREGWERTLAINLSAPFELTRLAVSDMREARWGRIVMVSSTAGTFGAPSLGPYSASKSGIIGLTRSVAQDVASFNTTCNAVCPGWVRTDMADRDAEREARERGVDPEQIWRERAESYPSGRVVEVQEIAAVIAFLASEAASGVNGEAITVALGSPW